MPPSIASAIRARVRVRVRVPATASVTKMNSVTVGILPDLRQCSDEVRSTWQGRSEIRHYIYMQGGYVPCHSHEVRWQARSEDMTGH